MFVLVTAQLIFARVRTVLNNSNLYLCYSNDVWSAIDKLNVYYWLELPVSNLCMYCYSVIVQNKACSTAIGVLSQSSFYKLPNQVVQ